MSIFESSRKMTIRERTAYDLGFHEGRNTAVIHGQWNPKPYYKSDGNGGVYKYCDFYLCSKCAAERPIVPPYNYCPNCGANMMDGDRNA